MTISGDVIISSDITSNGAGHSQLATKLVLSVGDF